MVALQHPCFYLLLSFSVFFFFYRAPDPRDLHSFPTRRSSDLGVSFATVSVPIRRTRRAWSDGRPSDQARRVRRMGTETVAKETPRSEERRVGKECKSRGSGAR